MNRLLVLLAAVASAAIAGCEGCGPNPDGYSTLVPLLTPSARTVDFGAAWVGRDAIREIVLDNSGGAPATLDARVVGDGAFSLVSIAPPTLAGGAELTLSLRFAPVIEGSMSGTLVVESDAENAPRIEVALIGAARTPPDCDDDNECTDDAFDYDVGECVYAFPDRACGTGDPCLSDGRCVEGRCLGTPTLCTPSADCMLAYCDSDEGGCVEVQRPGSCDDEDPCTVDTCVAGTGCKNPEAPDLTPCGEYSCAQASLCFSGECQTFTATDGFPCSDGDICTVGDKCASGACVGAYTEGDPQVIHEEPFTTKRGFFLDDGRYIAVSTVSAVPAKMAFRELVPAEGGRLAAGRSWHLETSSYFLSAQSTFAPGVDSDRVAVFNTGLSVGLGILRFPIDGDPEFMLMPGVNARSAAILGSSLFVCEENELQTYELDGSEPALVDTKTLMGLCEELAVDGETQSLFAVFGILGDLWRLSISDGVPELDPAFFRQGPLWNLLAADGRVIFVESAGESWHLTVLDAETLETIIVDESSIQWIGLGDDELWGTAAFVGGNLVRYPLSEDEERAVQFVGPECKPSYATVKDDLIRCGDSSFLKWTQSGAAERFVVGLENPGALSLRTANGVILARSEDFLHVWQPSDSIAPEVERTVYLADIVEPNTHALDVRELVFSGPGIGPSYEVRVGESLPVTNYQGSIHWVATRSDVDAQGNVVRTSYWVAQPPLPSLADLSSYDEFDSGAALVDEDVLFFSRLAVRGADGVVGAYVAAFDAPTHEPGALYNDLDYLGSVFVPLSDGGDLSPPTYVHVDVEGGVLAITDGTRARVVAATDPTAMEIVHAFDIEAGKFAMGTESVLMGRTLVPFIPDSGIVGEPIVLDDPDSLLLGNRWPLLLSGETLLMRDHEVLRYLNLADGAVTLEYELSLPSDLRSVEPVDDNLYVVSDDALRIVFPPCPPPGE